jgi:gamma-aminobutyric acid type B receptor
MYMYMQSLRVKEEYFIWVCYEASSPNFFWRIFLFTYLAILQIVGMLLAFQTRKVKIKGLNDSKFVATIIYISSIVLVALALVTFALRAYINIGTGVFVAGILTLTTIFLALNFIPKVKEACSLAN